MNLRSYYCNHINLRGMYKHIRLFTYECFTNYIFIYTHMKRIYCCNILNNNISINNRQTEKV